MWYLIAYYHRWPIQELLRLNLFKMKVVFEGVYSEDLQNSCWNRASADSLRNISFCQNSVYFINLYFFSLCCPKAKLILLTLFFLSLVFICLVFFLRYSEATFSLLCSFSVFLGASLLRFLTAGLFMLAFFLGLVFFGLVV